MPEVGPIGLRGNAKAHHRPNTPGLEKTMVTTTENNGGGDEDLVIAALMTMPMIIIAMMRTKTRARMVTMAIFWGDKEDNVVVDDADDMGIYVGEECEKEFQDGEERYVGAPAPANDSDVNCDGGEFDDDGDYTDNDPVATTDDAATSDAGDV